MAVDQYRHLVGSALKGDPKAWSALGDSYHQRILDYCRIFLPSADQAELAVQEIFLHAWGSREPAMDVEAFDSWIFSTARAVCAKYLTGSEVPVIHAAVFRCEEQPVDPFRQSEPSSRPLQPLSSAAEPIMTRLDQLDRVIFNLSFVEKMTSEQIAVNLLPPMSSRAIRARIALNIEPLIASLQAWSASGATLNQEPHKEQSAQTTATSQTTAGSRLPTSTEQLVTILRAENGSWGPSCIKPEVLLELVAYPGSRPDTLDLLDHVAVCALCRRGYSETRAAYHIAELERRSAAHPPDPSVDVFTRASVPANRLVAFGIASQKGSLQTAINSAPLPVAQRAGPSSALPDAKPLKDPKLLTFKEFTLVGYVAGLLSITILVVGALGIHEYRQRAILERSHSEDLLKEHHLEEVAAELKRTSEETNARAQMLDLKAGGNGAAGAGPIQAPADSKPGLTVTRIGSASLASGRPDLQAAANIDVSSKLSLPTQLTEQAVRARKLSGAGDQSIVVDSPNMVSVIETRPRFTWERVAGVRRYRIQLLDHDLKPTASPLITSATTVVFSKDLVTGETYTWSVTANRGSKTYSGHGSFLVLKPIDVKQIDALHRDGSLKLGVAYAKAGLFDAAYDQFLWALRKNPNDENAKRLRDELIANRHFK